MKDSAKDGIVAVCIIGIGAVAAFGPFVAAAWVILHFLRKFW